MAREVELKAVVEDFDEARRCVERAGARLAFAGRLEDRRWDTPDRALARRDHVFRVRRYLGAEGERAELGFKGPTTYVDGFKVREELGAPMGDVEQLSRILTELGYIVTRAIDRSIVQYELRGAVIRFEQYPRMDRLVEIEGEPAAIEQAIAATGIPREQFSTDRLPAFVARFEARTGQRAALCDDELTGRIMYLAEDA